MYEPASLGMFQCHLQRILCDFEVIMFFRKDPPQTEGRRNADQLIKTPPESIGNLRSHPHPHRLAVHIDPAARPVLHEEVHMARAVAAGRR